MTITNQILPMDKSILSRLQPNSESNKIAYLKLYVDSNFPKLKNLYQEHVNSHNDSLGIMYDVESNSFSYTNPYPNSGFDLIVPFDISVPPVNESPVTMAKLKVKAEMYTIENSSTLSTGYFLMPRSSISKTPLIQANHIGLIDMGYRGEIMAAVRCLSNSEYTISENTRLFQLCHPSAIPIWVELVENETDLSSTERGDGGFGSTGIIGGIRI